MGLRTVYLENIWKSLAQSLYVPKGLMNAIIALIIAISGYNSDQSQSLNPSSASNQLCDLNFLICKMRGKTVLNS